VKKLGGKLKGSIAKKSKEVSDGVQTLGTNVGKAPEQMLAELLKCVA